VDVIERVSTALACAAVDQRLAGVLFFDLESSLHRLARWFSAKLLGEENPRVVPLGANLAEDPLWERLVPVPDQAPERGGVEFRWAAGPLTGFDRSPIVVVIHDLAQASVPVARAAVTLLGSDVAHLERSGLSREWRPEDWWLARLHREDAHLVSPHLLDRFALRVDAARLRMPGAGSQPLPDPDPVWVQAIAAARRGKPLPDFSGAAADRVVALRPGEAHGARRDLALARLARAVACLAAAPEVLPGHVDSAADIVGLVMPGSARGSQTLVRPVRTESPRRWREATPADHTESRLGAAGPAGAGTGNGRVSATAGEAELLPPQPAGLPARPAGPYPEDEAQSRRAPDPLRVGWQRALVGPPGGYSIGTELARDTRDIAVFATLLHAAWYQRFRAGHQAGGPLRVLRQDLRSHRRAPLPGHLLVLVLDHTSRVEDWDWYQPLAPYLRWAYVMRARVGVIEVGGQPAAGRQELRATQFRSRSMLDPRVPSALARPPGRATPLAHGLSLAAAMLRNYRQQGNWPPANAVLVVATDGRANVPLAASQSGVPPLEVGAQGITDALGEARKISALNRADRVVIDPGLRIHGHLTAQLAADLGAPLVHGTPVTDGTAPGFGVRLPPVSSGERN
jgi:magnesium chelatase subunit D